jgi:hypothetical protein
MTVIEMHREVAETLREMKTKADLLEELLRTMDAPVYARNRAGLLQQVIEETIDIMLAAMTRDCPDEDSIATYRPDLVQEDPSGGPESELKKLDFETDYLCDLLERFLFRKGFIPLDEEEEDGIDELAEAVEAQNSRLTDRFAALCAKSPTHDSTSDAGPGATTGMPESTK